jgi:hypothetical protein
MWAARPQRAPPCLAILASASTSRPNIISAAVARAASAAAPRRGRVRALL